MEIQGIPANITDDELEGKVIHIFSCLGIEVKGYFQDLHSQVYDNLLCLNSLVQTWKIVIDLAMQILKIQSSDLLTGNFAIKLLIKKWTCISQTAEGWTLTQ